MKKIEFMVDMDVEKMLDEIHEENLKKFPDATINETARVLMIGSMLTHGTNVVEKAISDFASKFTMDAIKMASTNPELIKAVKEIFSKSAEFDAKKWLEDKNKEKEKK